MIEAIVEKVSQVFVIGVVAFVLVSMSFLRIAIICPACGEKNYGDTCTNCGYIFTGDEDEEEEF